MSVIEVSIGLEQAPGTFRVRVLASSVGEASAVAELATDELLGRRAELQQAVLASSVASRRVLPETERCVQEVGQRLFAALLGTGEVAGRYRAAAAVAAERGEELRVVLRINDPKLAGLPWEAMYDESAGGYVCRRDQLVRHVPVASAAAPLMVDPPLRILGVVSSPRGLPMLDVGREQELLEGAVARLAGEGLVEVVWAPSAAWADLQDVLLGGRWHLLHFIGHGDFDPDRDEGVLALTGADGRADLVEASRLVDLLRQARPLPRLVVLNSCSGAATGPTDLFSGTAAALVRGGVSAVAAMQYEISDPAAVAFARGFYRAIAHGRGVDEAVSSGRAMILGLSGRTLEWMTPVLYLRGHDSHLFTLPAARSSVSQSIRRGSEDTPTRIGPDTTGDVVRTPQLGLEFWQDEQLAPMFLQYGPRRKIVAVHLRPKPFHMRFPLLGPQMTVQVCAWWDDSIFALEDKATTHDLEFFGRGTGGADYEFGSGTLRITRQGHGYFIGNRIARSPGNKGDIFFASVFDGALCMRRSLAQQEDDIFLTVYIDQDREEGLAAADSPREYNNRARPLHSSLGSPWYEYVILQFR